MFIFKELNRNHKMPYSGVLRVTRMHRPQGIYCLIGEIHLNNELTHACVLLPLHNWNNVFIGVTLYKSH